MNWPKNMSIKFITSEIHLIRVLTSAHLKRWPCMSRPPCGWADHIPAPLLNENVRLIPTIHSWKSHQQALSHTHNIKLAWWWLPCTSKHINDHCTFHPVNFVNYILLTRKKLRMYYNLFFSHRSAHFHVLRVHHGYIYMPALRLYQQIY